MVDFHRHFSPELPLAHHHGVTLWYATSREEQWPLYETTGEDMKRGYGHLPLSDDPSPRFSLEHLKTVLELDTAGYIAEVGDEPFFPFEQQMQQLTAVLTLARELQRVVVVHHRGSIVKVAETLFAFSCDVPIIIHRYSGSVETARELHRKGIRISLSPALRSKNMSLSHRLKDLDVPFLLETDYTGTDEVAYLDILTKHYRWVSAETKIPLSTLVENQHEQSSILTH
ncbi:MAG: TatD family hydrolase [Sphaerochaetaceae bacterium]|nr:TatD family hydrolase [Sphaerochaetaceae bacterium]